MSKIVTNTSCFTQFFSVVVVSGEFRGSMVGVLASNGGKSSNDLKVFSSRYSIALLITQLVGNKPRTKLIIFFILNYF